MSFQDNHSNSQSSPAVSSECKTGDTILPRIAGNDAAHSGQYETTAVSHVKKTYHANGFEINCKTMAKLSQCQNNSIFDKFKQIDDIFNAQIIANKDDNFLFEDFMFTSANDSCYNKYSIADFMSFFYCKSHSQNVLNNINNYTVMQIDNLLTKMKHYNCNLKHTCPFIIPHKILKQCLQLHYNQMTQTKKRKCTIFAQIFNLLIKHNSKRKLYIPIYNGDEHERHEYFTIVQLMCDCLVEHMLHFGIDSMGMASYQLYKSFYQDCKMAAQEITPIKDFTCRDYDFFEQNVIKLEMRKVINRLAMDKSHDVIIGSIMSDLLKILDAWKDGCTIHLNLIIATIELLIENGKNNIIAVKDDDKDDDNYSQKLHMIRIFLGIILDKNHGYATHDRRNRKREMIDVILSKIYSFDDNVIDQLPTELDTLCYWWVHICLTQGEKGIELSLFQIESILPSPKVLTMLFKKWMSMDTRTSIREQMSTKFLTMRDILHGKLIVSNSSVPIVGRNLLGTLDDNGKFLAQCLANNFEDCIYAQELRLLNSLNIFEKFGLGIGIKKIILNYKYAIVSRESLILDDNNTISDSGNDRQSAWDIANDEIERRSESCIEYQLFGQMFYFVPKLFNWDLNYISQRLICAKYNNQHVANKWKIYFDNKIETYCSCSFSYPNSNDKTIFRSKLSDRVSDQMVTFKEAHDQRCIQLQLQAMAS